MALFTLETDAVSSVGSSISSLASQISELSSTVNGYDTTAEDFDFGTPKSVIAGNIEACSIKVKNTASLIESVVSSHTALQSSLKYSGTSDTSSTGTSSTDTSSTDTSSSSSDDYSSGGYYSSGGHSSSGGGGGNTSPETETEQETEAPVAQDVEVTTDLKEVQYIYTDIDKLKDGDSKKLFTRDDFKYADNGFAMIGNRLVIACDQSYGKVGDVVDFIQKDGTVVSCVIGALTYSAEMKNKVSFFVKKEGWTADSPIEATKKLTENTAKTINRGNIDLVNAKEAQQAATQTGTTTGTGTEVGTNTKVYITTDASGNEVAVVTTETTPEGTGTNITNTTTTDKTVVATDTSADQTVIATADTSQDNNDIVEV